jgi:SAM-dependent methyltransferase
MGDKMKYYELHEQAYKQLKQKGNDSWDQFLGQAEDYDNFCLKDFMDFGLSRYKGDKSKSAALEIGCGTGPASSYLSKNGFSVDGIDISQTAIEVAKKEAEKRGLDVNFFQGDICNDDLGSKTYDVVVDGHCLHCIVTHEDREKVLKNILKLLKPKGQFWIDTMLGWDGCEFGGQRWDEDGVLWTKVGNHTNYENVKEVDGQMMLAHRRVYRDKSMLENELKAAGFKIEWSKVEEPEQQGHPSAYQAICTLM